MKYLTLLFMFCFMPICPSLRADVPIIEYNDARCLERLDTLTKTELWDLMLKNQTNLMFTHEFAQISQYDWWQKSRNILDIGSGNGTYLYTLSKQAPEKYFRGLEKRDHSVREANEEYGGLNLSFFEDDAEVFHDELRHTADVLLFRFVLQYLKNPLETLKNSAHYLTSNGYIIIVESSDESMTTFHPLPTLFEATKRLSQQQQESHEAGNRKISLELLRSLKEGKSTLNSLYEIVYTNLDENGKIIKELYRVDGKQKDLLFNQALLYSYLLQKHWHIPIDIKKTYSELLDYYNDDKAWTVMATHLLILKRK